jgi:transcriptional repressor NrdR
MKCPICAGMDTRVIDSRVIKEGTEIRRRRLCDTCSHRFTTYEHAERHLPVVIKKDGRREPWRREKIMNGLSRACEKRPISIEEIERLADNVAEDACAIGEPEISSNLIGERIMARLHVLDEVAYVRFASVYRQFKDIDEFMNELADLMRSREMSSTGSSR